MQRRPLLTGPMNVFSGPKTAVQPNEARVQTFPKSVILHVRQFNQLCDE